VRTEPVVADHALLGGVLKDFARTLVRPYDVGEVLYQLTDRTVEILGAAGAGVSLVDDDGKLRFVSATGEHTATVERVQEECQMGPCIEAHLSGSPVLVVDVADTEGWPLYRTTAVGAGLRAVAGIPMHIQHFRLGSLNIYDDKVRQWSTDDVEVAQALADMASSLVVNARQLEEHRRLAGQLQHALDSRVVIEQAKGSIARDLGISVDQAFGRLRDYARSHNRKLHDVARQALDGTIKLD